MLLTGDIEKKAEDNILKNKNVREELKNMTVLKAAHHGSASSSGEEFIKLVNPEVTVSHVESITDTDIRKRVHLKC